jgi:hypothetical protein
MLSSVVSRGRVTGDAEGAAVEFASRSDTGVASDANVPRWAMCYARWPLRGTLTLGRPGVPNSDGGLHRGLHDVAKALPESTISRILERA